MKSRFLLDSNVLSEPLKARPDAAVVESIQANVESVATASLVWHELLVGVRGLAGRRRALAERFVETVIGPNIPILPYDASAATWHARERARLLEDGREPPFVDGQIAAIAAVNGLTLVTRNLRDFRTFSELEVVSWHST